MRKLTTDYTINRKRLLTTNSCRVDFVPVYELFSILYYNVKFALSRTINFSYIFYLPLYLVVHVNFLLNEYDDDDYSRKVLYQTEVQSFSVLL